jgi:hypothetical protein
MRARGLWVWSSTLCLCAVVARAQETNETEKLKQQLEATQRKFEQQQREMREGFERLMREQQSQIDALKQQIEAARTNAPPAAAPPVGPSPPIASPEKATPPAEAAWSPTQPIRVGTAQAYMGISFDSLFAVGGMSKPNEVQLYEPGGHDPKQNGFTVQNLETVFDGKVDPWFRAQANIVLQLTPDLDTTIEAEEAWLETMALPWNLQFKAGQYLTQFGRLNTQHPHSWDFVDEPLVNARFLGPDGLRNPGIQLSWLAPTPFYSELFFSVQNSAGGTAYSFDDTHGDQTFLGRLNTNSVTIDSMADLLYSARYAASFDLNDANTVLLGGSGAFGPNPSGNDTRTQLYGVDLLYKWKSPHQAQGFPFVAWQSEWMFRRYEAGAFQFDANGDGVPDVNLPAEVLRDWGFYSQVSYGFTPHWVASLRGDYLNGGTGAAAPTVDNDRQWRLSPALTWYPSEFSKIRLQYNYENFQTLGPAWGIWMQFEFLLGSHAAHKF